MAVNKVVYGGEVLIDLTGLTVSPETLAEGVIAISAAGEIIVGTAKFSIEQHDTVLGSSKLGSTIVRSGTQMGTAKLSETIL